MEIECCIFCFFSFSQRVQTLNTEYKYGQFYTPLSKSDCTYSFVLAISIYIYIVKVVICHIALRFTYNFRDS